MFSGSVRSPQPTAPPRSASFVPEARRSAADQETADGVLAERIARGDDRALECLLHRYSRGIHGLAIHMLGDRAEAEDVVQEVFVTVWRRAGEITDPSALRTWLFQVARRRCLIVLRGRRSRRTEPVGEVPEHRVAVAAAAMMRDPQRAAEADAGVIALRRALAALPHRQREVWLLAEVAELPHQRIGQLVGAGEQAVRGRLCRARTNLAALMRAWR